MFPCIKLEANLERRLANVTVDKKLIFHYHMPKAIEEVKVFITFLQPSMHKEVWKVLIPQVMPMVY